MASKLCSSVDRRFIEKFDKEDKILRISTGFRKKVNKSKMKAILN